MNKVSTKADIRFDVVNCSWMSRTLKQAIMRREANRMNKNGELLISSQVTRSQADNLEDAIGRLQGLLDEAAESIKPIESDPEKVKTLEKRKKKVCCSPLRTCGRLCFAVMLALFTAFGKRRALERTCTQTRLSNALSNLGNFPSTVRAVRQD